MYRKIFSFAIILALAFAAFGGVGSALASARTANWMVAVTYQNVGTAATPVTVNFYPEGSSTPIVFDPLSGGTLAAGAGRSFSIGSVSGIGSTFTGNAVMSSQQPLVATVVQLSKDAGFKVRLLSNGFQASDGSDQYLIATTLFNRFNRTSVFSIQNTGASDVVATFNFYDADDAGALASTIDHTIKGNSSKYIEMDKVGDTGLTGFANFNGSAIVTVPTGNAIVGAASELYLNQNTAANFEGIPLAMASNTIYMATALCNQFTKKTAYAVQNASLTTSATINVTYKDTSGGTKATDGPYTIGPGQKKSVLTCSPNDSTNMQGFTGSATITSTGAPIVVIGKASCQDNCPPSEVLVRTAFLGQPSGGSKLAAPYVRWANNTNFNAPDNTGKKMRCTLAIQNMESTSAQVDVKYYGKDGGAPLATETLTIPGYSKGNSSANSAGALGLGGMYAGEFGYYPGGLFGGSVIIEANSANPTAEFIAIARCRVPGVAEDYNAMAAP